MAALTTLGSLKTMEYILICGLYIHFVNGLYDFVCPDFNSVAACSSMDDCQACQTPQDSSGNEVLTSGACTQCITDSFLYSYNQCENCQDTFGDACLHCADGLGCQQCDSGYTRLYNSDCNVYFCQLSSEIQSHPVSGDPVGCDEHCMVCQSSFEQPYCTQCESGWFTEDYTGLFGCKNCVTEYGYECYFCSNGIGCQQCIQPFTREYNVNGDGLYSCECNEPNNDCGELELITFEEFTGNAAAVIPNGYFDFKWQNSIAVNRYIFANGHSGLFNTLSDDTFGSYLLVNDFSTQPFIIGESGGVEFKVIQFDAVSTDLTQNALKCWGYLNGNQKFVFNTGSVTNKRVRHVWVDNNIVIDQFECISTNAGQGASWVAIDNLNIIKV